MIFRFVDADTQFLLECINIMESNVDADSIPFLENMSNMVTELGVDLNNRNLSDCNSLLQRFFAQLIQLLPTLRNNKYYKPVLVITFYNMELQIKFASGEGSLDDMSKILKTAGTLLSKANNSSNTS